jgi:hypothetical protein
LTRHFGIHNVSASHLQIHSNIAEVRSYRGADCDAGHCLAVVKLRENSLTKKDTGKVIMIRTFNTKCERHATKLRV